jgi:hypothetical protein
VRRDILKDRSTSGSETNVRNWIISLKKHILSSAEQQEAILVVFDTAMNEGLHFYSLIKNLTISNGTLNAISSNAFPGRTVCFSVVMIGIF